MSRQNFNKMLHTKNSHLNFLREFRNEYSDQNITPTQLLQSARQAWHNLTPEEKLRFDEDQYVKRIGKSVEDGAGEPRQDSNLTHRQTLLADIKEQSTSKGIVSETDVNIDYSE